METARCSSKPGACCPGIPKSTRRSGTSRFSPEAGESRCRSIWRTCADITTTVEWCLLPMHRSEEHTSELQSLTNLVCRLLLEKKKKTRLKIDNSVDQYICQ